MKVLATPFTQEKIDKLQIGMPATDWRGMTRQMLRQHQVPSTSCQSLGIVAALWFCIFATNCKLALFILVCII
jgi:hypothetical protein